MKTLLIIVAILIVIITAIVIVTYPRYNQIKANTEKGEQAFP